MRVKTTFNSFVVKTLVPTYFRTVNNEKELKLAQRMLSAKDYLSTGLYSMFSDGRNIRIGKMIKTCLKKKAFMTNDQQNEAENALKILEMFSSPQNRENYIVVISMHPYDIAGMSTDRGWRSCMNLVDGRYKRYVMSSMLNGVLIAYFCRKNDTTDWGDTEGKHHKNNKPNIQHPLGRVLIKPYHKPDDKNWLDNRRFFLACSLSYGTFPSRAVAFVQNWIDTNWNDKVSLEKHDRVELAEGMYDENFDSQYRYDNW